MKKYYSINDEKINLKQSDNFFQQFSTTTLNVVILYIFV